MMNQKAHIDTQVQKTIEALDNLPQLKAHYLFRTKVMERISQEALTHPQQANPAMQSVKFALMAFLLIINIGSALVLMLSNDTEQTLSKQDTLESLTNEYSNPALSYYLDNDNSVEDPNE
ncbi:hypothetical protein OO006_11760 [Prosthecochloris sp. SCSIO W1101]|uniref:hypothetical protein n=1 Tax=Prosthecochloris sp. SCSIO W1101 TaxID=2992242 RepID=UPI00223E4004|nr:hypothetical protein [Prosthecochloris sp. SCSIO W1101]UZJ41016.1 hypothetical protein OO006_11760 [Prosthecochloris sp. SCSIO W1101]